MESYGDVLAGAGIVAYIVIGLAVLLFAWWGYRLIRGGGKQKQNADLPSDESYEGVSAGIKPPATTSKGILGKGNIKCLCFRKIKGVNVADFTTISEAIGELYQFDPSCPTPGSGYIVKENEKGEIVDYDPREVKCTWEESPDFAHLVMNGGQIIKNFWAVQVQWWKSTSVWFAAAMLVVVFITSLAVVG